MNTAPTRADVRTLLLTLIGTATDRTQPEHRIGPWRAPAGLPASIQAELLAMSDLGLVATWQGIYCLSGEAKRARAAYDEVYMSDGLDTGPGWAADLVAWADEAQARHTDIERLPYVGRIPQRSAA